MNGAPLENLWNSYEVQVICHLLNGLHLRRSKTFQPWWIYVLMWIWLVCKSQGSIGRVHDGLISVYISLLTSLAHPPSCTCCSSYVVSWWIAKAMLKPHCTPFVLEVFISSGAVWAWGTAINFAAMLLLVMECKIGNTNFDTFCCTEEWYNPFFTAKKHPNSMVEIA